MGQGVTLQLVGCLEALITAGAVERTFTCVNAPVLLEVRRTFEALPTELASEGPLLCVYQAVALEV